MPAPVSTQTHRLFSLEAWKWSGFGTLPPVCVWPMPVYKEWSRAVPGGAVSGATSGIPCSNHACSSLPDIPPACFSVWEGKNGMGAFFMGE